MIPFLFLPQLLSSLGWVWGSKKTTTQSKVFGKRLTFHLCRMVLGSTKAGRPGWPCWAFIPVPHSDWSEHGLTFPFTLISGKCSVGKHSPHGVFPSFFQDGTSFVLFNALIEKEYISFTIPTLIRILKGIVTGSLAIPMSRDSHRIFILCFILRDSYLRRQ